MHVYRILLIEDDPSFAKLLIDLLQEAHYKVNWVVTGAEALYQLEKERPHLVISDISLPDMNGLHFFKYLQTHLQEVPPYVFLTGKDQELDIVLGLEYGAEDYIVKPILPRVFLTRIEKIIQRYFPAISSSESLYYQGLRLDPRKRQAFYHTNNLQLKRYEFDLLFYLIQNPGQIHTRQQLLERIWKVDDAISPRNVDNIILALRKKMRQAGCASELIQTVRGIGYRLVSRNL